MDTVVTVIHPAPTFIPLIFIVPTLPETVPGILMVMGLDTRRIIIPIRAVIPIPASTDPITTIAIIINWKFSAPPQTRGFLF